MVAPNSIRHCAQIVLKAITAGVPFGAPGSANIPRIAWVGEGEGLGRVPASGVVEGAFCGAPMSALEGKAEIVTRPSDVCF